MKSNAQAFLIDFIEDNPAWAELFQIIDEHNDEANLTTIQELLDIRRINGDTNDVLAEEAIRQLGINVTRDMLSYRLPSLKRVIDCLPDWQQVSGTTQWNKFVGMLLGGQFDTTRLYTADYQTFLPTPLGTLIQDGGNWYKTTHASLEVDAHLINSGLDLTITKDAETLIVNALQLVGMEQQEAEDWFNNHIGFDPVNNDIEQYTARSVMFQKRISDLFYQWAPIEEILEGVYATVNIAAAVYMTAHTVVEPVRRFMVGAPLASAINFIQPEYVHGGEFLQFGAIVKYSDNTEETVVAHVEDNVWIAERDGENVKFNEPLAISVMTLTLSYNGTKTDMELRIFPLGVEPDPDSLSIECPTLYGNASAKVRVYGKYGTGLTRELTDSGMVRLSTTLGTIDGSTLILPSVDADTTLDISALYQGQFNLSKTQEFDVNRSVRDLVPVSIALIMDDELDQGIDIPIKCSVTYNDTTSKLVVAQARSTSEHTSVVEDVLKSDILRQDYMTSIYVEFGEGEPVQAVKQVTMKAPAINLATVDIVIPSTIVERDIIRPKAMALYVLASATDAQIAARDPSIIVAYTEVSGIWFSSQDDANDVHSLPSVEQSTGQFTAPLVDGDAVLYSLHFAYIDVAETKTFSKNFLIDDIIMIPRSVDLRSAPSISSASTLMLPTTCLWNNGLVYAAAAAVTVEYLPSQSAKEEARARTIQLQQDAVQAGEDPLQFDPDNPDYARWITLNVTVSTNEVYDPVLARKFKEYVLYFQGDLHGSARISMTYDYDGTTITNYRDLQLTPSRSLVDSITIECPTEMFDRKRTFCRLLATYVDGTQEYVTAAQWSGIWADKDTDEYKVLQFSPGRYSGTAIVEIVEGRTPDSYKDFRAMEISRLPMFNSIGDLTQLENSYFDGAILQTGKCNEVTYTQVQARFFRISSKMDLVVTPQPKESVNNIINSRIEGATQISADVLSESYTLVNMYETGGVAKTLDGSYVETPKTQFELEVDSEWAIINNYYVKAGPNGSQMLVPTSDSVAEIDASGTLTPSQNVDGAVEIRARFTCDQYQIEKTLLVYLVQANTYLRSIGIIGPDIVWDVSDRNPEIGYENGRWYVPFQLRVIIDPDDELVTTDAIWSIGDETNVDGVSVDPLNGHLFISQSQLSDGLIGLRAVFTKQNPQSLADETIIASRTVELNTQNTILSGFIENPASNIEPNTDYKFVANYERRSGQKGTSVLPDANSVKFQWNVIKSVSGFSLSQDGSFRFQAAKDPQSVQVECIITEQRTSISLTQEITCPGIGFPQDLTVGGFTNVRDDSSMQMAAMLGRTGTFVKEDVSAKCLWQITNSKGDVVDVQGISINSSTGRLAISLLLNDTDFGVKVLYIEGQQRLTQTHFMKAFSSYPRFGIAPFGLTTISAALAQLPSRLRSNVGGTFVLSTKTDEYGYFVVRQSFGTAVFAAASDSQGNVNKGWLAFDGAQWPVTGDNGKKGPIVSKMVYDNLTENVLIYRTNARAFGSSVITVRYQ